MAQKHKNLSLHKFINEFKYEQKQARKMRAHKNGRKKNERKRDATCNINKHVQCTHTQAGRQNGCSVMK